MKLTIPIHSFVDLITNSSTEIYVEATESTVSAIKELVNSLLKAGGSTLTCDDLFTISLSKSREDLSEDENVEEYWDTPSTRSISVTVLNDSPHTKTAASILSNLTGMFNIEASYDG